MSKKFRGKDCVYCLGVNSSIEGDHVFPRSFFPTEERPDLPQVPSCRNCNRIKSDLEHYLATTLLLGSRLPTAKQELIDDFSKRISKNQRLNRELYEGMEHIFFEENGRNNKTITTRFHGETLLEFIRYAVRGLAYVEWESLIPSSHCVGAAFLSTEVEDYFAPFLLPSPRRIERTIGTNRIRYVAIQASDDLSISIWCFKLFGGVVLSDSDAQNALPPRIWAISSNQRIPDFYYG